MTTSDLDWQRLLSAARDATHPAAGTVMQLASNLGSGIDPDSIGCSITLVDGDGYVTPAASNAHALGLDEAQYLHNEGPCVAAARSGDWYDIEAVETEQRWPYFVATALDHGVRSSLSVPLTLPARPSALNFYSASERAFADPRKRSVAGFLARCLSSALVTQALEADAVPAPERPGFRESVERGQVISRAVDSVRAQYGIGLQAAFRRLAEASRVQVRPLLEIAEDVLREAGPERSSTPQSGPAV